MWLFQSEALAGGHAARPPAVPGPSPGAPGPAVPPATASRTPPPATAPGSRPANARDVKLRALQRPRRHIAVALARSTGCREQVVPVVRVVQAVRAGAVRSTLVTTSMWQRGGWNAPENNPEVSAAAARTTRHCFNDPSYRGPLPTRYRG